MRYKYLYEHLKKNQERMHKSMRSYDPLEKHPEIFKTYKKLHKGTHADDFDSDEKHNGKKSAAKDFNLDKEADELGDSKDSHKKRSAKEELKKLKK